MLNISCRSAQAFIYTLLSPQPQPCVFLWQLRLSPLGCGDGGFMWEMIHQRYCKWRKMQERNDGCWTGSQTLAKITRTFHVAGFILINYQNCQAGESNFFCCAGGNGELWSLQTERRRGRRLPSATWNVCFVKGEIKPSQQVFHFLVSFLIRESSLTTLGRQEGMWLLL